MGSIAIVGAGNVGQAIAGHMAVLGDDVRMFSRWDADFDAVRAVGGIELTGEVTGRGMPGLLTTDLAEAVRGVDVVVVAAPAFAHAYLSEHLAKLLEPEQVALFQPGVLGSSVELTRHFARAGRTPCLIAETATSLYTCRLAAPAQVFVGALKQAVNLAAIPQRSVDVARERLRPYFGDRYAGNGDGLTVGLDNCNPIYHVPPAVLNIKTVEDGAGQPQHALVTPRIAEVVHELDRERLALARELGAPAGSFWDFLETAYGVTEGSYVERIEQGYGRQAFPEPDSLTHRYFTEDIPFGLVIWSSLAQRIGLPMPLTDSFIRLSSVLCGRDWTAEGRTADALGLQDADAEQIRTAFREGTQRLDA